MKTLEIIYEDEELIAINKPHGLLVHRSRIANDAKEFALQMLRDQIDQRVYPCHRLDRKTSGVLLFAKNEKCNKQIQQLFQDRKTDKKYMALVRGFISEEGTINYPLLQNDKLKEAVTNYKLLQRFEISEPLGKFSTSRYSLVELKPITGRFHQLRKHMAHIFHPIIGDRPHGCNKQNKMWKERFSMDKMLLHAAELKFEFSEGKEIKIEANKSGIFNDVLLLLNTRNTL